MLKKIRRTVCYEHMFIIFASKYLNTSIIIDMSFLKKVLNLYVDGFKNMTWGRNLWLIIFIKLFIMFAILKLFFFSNFLGSKFENDQEKGDYVIEQLINPKH